MDITQILRTGAKLFNQSSADTAHLSENNIVAALSRLLGGDSDGQGINLQNIIKSLDGAGLASIAASWLGKGSNAAISTDDIAKVFHPDKISAFASELELPEHKAVSGLQDVLPAIVDHASPGGEIAGDLFKAVGGLAGIMKIGASIFGENKPNN
ncbi:YidB family protein [Shewanella violacea]|uniref:DUF937 domain-containing protein n=1 Tax=Shewanella violacea (strain JCM 10179 / CIP 106290 / LMG 19151 / DSS12) TaxID=637905 RepID=D4ZCM0_SHEVD|nr:YidB family protein [Shewanella violacea]BAJ03765.1 conserved hypothetical protein [Shewanella violacea DSS12]